MIPPFVAASFASNALHFVGKHWRAFAIGAFAIACFIGFQIVQHKLDKAEQRAEQSERQEAQTAMKLEVSNRSINNLQASIENQNAAIDGLATDGQARIAEGQRAILEEVRRGAKASTVARELNATPTRDADQSKTSPKVLANKELL